MTERKPILVIGSLNMDLVATTKCLPEKGETVLGKSFATFAGGKGANQAVAARKLGASVYMVGCIGQDSFGKQLKRSLEEIHVDTTHIRNVQTATGTALITVDESGANTIVVACGANLECNPADVDAALEHITEPGILLIQNEVPQATVEYAIRAAKTKKWTVIFNPAPARLLAETVLPLIDIIVPNETEVALLTQCSIISPEDLSVAAKMLLDQGVNTVIITMGSNGASSWTRTKFEHIEPYRVTAVDTTAAGDCYTGALAVGLAEGRTLTESMTFAAAAAALSVTKAGAQPSLPRRAEVDRFLNNSEEM